MFIEILEGHVTSERWDNFEKVFRKRVKGLSNQLRRIYLVQDVKNGELWRIISVWLDEKSFDESFSKALVEACTDMFKEVEVKPTHRVFRSEGVHAQTLESRTKEGMFIDILEGRVDSTKWDSFKKTFRKRISHIPNNLIRTTLAQDMRDESLWRIFSVWRAKETQDEAHFETCSLMFRDIKVEPTLRTFVIKGYHSHHENIQPQVFF